MRKELIAAYETQPYDFDGDGGSVTSMRIVRADGSAIDLPASEPLAVVPGDVLEFWVEPSPTATP